MPNEEQGKEEQAQELDMEPKLSVTTTEGRKFIGVALPWRGLIKTVAEQTRFFDQVLALAELPEPEEWRRILELAEQAGIPSIWRRARPSPLEMNAAALLTALAWSNKKYWEALICSFLKELGLRRAKLRGRPRLPHPGAARTLWRGLQIDRIRRDLRNGWRHKAKASKARGFDPGGEHFTAKLKAIGYDPQQIQAICEGHSLQDAAIRYYHKTQSAKENIELMTVRTDYARYKKLLRQRPPSS